MREVVVLEGVTHRIRVGSVTQPLLDTGLDRLYPLMDVKRLINLTTTLRDASVTLLSWPPLPDSKFDSRLIIAVPLPTPHRHLTIPWESFAGQSGAEQTTPDHKLGSC